MSDVIVERTISTSMRESDDCRSLTELAACFEIHDVHFIASFLSAQQNRLICHFEAPDAESVRQALRGAGLDIDSVWTAKVIRNQTDT